MSLQILHVLAEQHEVKVMPDFISDRVVVDGEEKELKHGHPIVMYKTIAYRRQVHRCCCCGCFVVTVVVVAIKT